MPLVRKNTANQQRMLRNQPPSYCNIDKFVTRIHKESVKQTRHLDIEARAEARERLVILNISGFIVTDADAGSKDFIVGVSWRFPGLRLDADSVRSPICRRRAAADGSKVQQTLHLMDYERLHKGEWFNDRLIHFWRVWLQHGPTYDRKEIDFYDSLLFHKYSLEAIGFDSVRTNLNPFDKKMVLIIMNTGGAHWNLVVLLNLDVLRMKRGGRAKDITSPMPCMLVLDSLREFSSGKLEHHRIVAWLQRREPTFDITPAMIPMFRPPVLQQNDSNSCGPLSILNAYCMIRLHKQAFTYEYAGVNLEGECLERCGQPFEDMVNTSLEFAYSLHDVDRILGEMRCIIHELSTKQRQAQSSHS